MPKHNVIPPLIIGAARYRLKLKTSLSTNLNVDARPYLNKSSINQKESKKDDAHGFYHVYKSKA
jgi:hypothetical protein